MSEDDSKFIVTRSGRRLTEADLEAMAEEAERGYEPHQLGPVRRGRPLMGSAPAEPMVVRVDPELRQAMQARADAEGTSVSEIVRAAVRQYLGAA